MKKMIFVSTLLVSSLALADEGNLLNADIASDVLTHGKEAFDQYMQTGRVETFTIAEIVGHIVIEADQRTVQITPPLLVAAFHMWGVYDQFQTSRARLSGLRSGMSVTGLVFLSASAYAAFSHARELLETASDLLMSKEKRHVS